MPAGDTFRVLAAALWAQITHLLGSKAVHMKRSSGSPTARPSAPCCGGGARLQREHGCEYGANSALRRAGGAERALTTHLSGKLDAIPFIAGI